MLSNNSCLYRIHDKNNMTYSNSNHIQTFYGYNRYRSVFSVFSHSATTLYVIFYFIYIGYHTYFRFSLFNQFHKFSNLLPCLLFRIFIYVFTVLNNCNSFNKVIIILLLYFEIFFYINKYALLFYTFYLKIHFSISSISNILKQNKYLKLLESALREQIGSHALP